MWSVWNINVDVATPPKFLLDLCICVCVLLLGRLPKVDLIILEGENVRPSVRTSVRPYVRPQKVSSISMKFGIQVEVDE